jgi:hypothetical protein
MADACGGIGTLMANRLKLDEQHTRTLGFSGVSAMLASFITSRSVERSWAWNRRRAEPAASRPISGYCSPACWPQPSRSEEEIA